MTVTCLADCLVGLVDLVDCRATFSVRFLPEDGSYLIYESYFICVAMSNYINDIPLTKYLFYVIFVKETFLQKALSWKKGNKNDEKGKILGEY